MRRPDPHRRGGLPQRVTIWEVGPRDGLQNEAATVPTSAKITFVERLVAAGLQVVETTSFVHPARVPQLADADDVLAGITREPGVRYPVLVPNERGWERALAAGARDIAIFGSATESFARRNLDRSVAGSVEMFAPVVQGAVAAGARVRAYLSMCFGDPWEGRVPLGQVVGAGLALLELGCEQLCLADTIGAGTPGHVTALVGRFADAGVAVDRLAVHFHDTYGQALANTYAALQAGVTTVDASAGGLGGCPFARSATGNLATEDLVWMLEGLGIPTGVDLDALVATSAWMAELLGRAPGSRVVAALAP